MFRFNRRKAVKFSAAIAVASITAICQAGGGKLDACKLISAAEASKRLGTMVTAHAVDTSAVGPRSASMCRYGNGHPGGGFMLLAGGAHYKDAAKEVARQEHEALADIPPGIEKPSFINVRGLGEAAYLAKTSAYFQLHVLAHGRVIVIDLNTAASKKAVSQARRIARAALTTLTRQDE